MAMIDKTLERHVEVQQELLNAVRRTRDEHRLAGSLRPILVVDEALHRAIGGSADVLCALARLESIACGTSDDQTADEGLAIACEGGKAKLTELGDEGGSSDNAEVQKKRVEELQGKVSALTKRLSNPGYVDKAPEKLVNETKAQLAQCEQELAQLTGDSDG
jgi:valyl-tRNA synthetase